MKDFAYGFSKKIEGVGFDEAVAEVTAALKAEGFGVLTEIDVSSTLKDKLGVDFRPYGILGACNPPLAHQAVAAEPHIGLLLPCNVLVQAAAGGGAEVSVADPKAMFSLVGNAAVAPIAEDVERRLRRVLDAV